MAKRVLSEASTRSHPLITAYACSYIASHAPGGGQRTMSYVIHVIRGVRLVGRRTQRRQDHGARMEYLARCACQVAHPYLSPSMLITISIFGRYLRLRALIPRTPCPPHTCHYPLSVPSRVSSPRATAPSGQIRCSPMRTNFSSFHRRHF